MNRVPLARFIIAAVAFACIAFAPAQPASSPGYLWLQQFSASYAGSGSQVTLAGYFVNECNGGLPAGSHLRLLFDQGILLDVPITAGFRKAQRFSHTVTVPRVPPPNDHITAYRFTVVLPTSQMGAMSATPGPDMKTSPCLVTPVLGIPSE